jgi:xanthine dehydrogenase accessory factor
MVTLIAKKGSAPRSTGARMIIKRDGTIISSIGGGFGEFEAAEHAREMLRNGPSVKRYTCRMNNTDAAAKGMICGGEIDILIQIMEA